MEKNSLIHKNTNKLVYYPNSNGMNNSKKEPSSGNSCCSFLNFSTVVLCWVPKILKQSDSSPKYTPGLLYSRQNWRGKILANLANCMLIVKISYPNISPLIDNMWAKSNESHMHVQYMRIAHTTHVFIRLESKMSIYNHLSKKETPLSLQNGVWRGVVRPAAIMSMNKKVEKLFMDSNGEQRTEKRGPFVKWTDSQKALIKKRAAEHSVTSSIHHFKKMTSWIWFTDNYSKKIQERILCWNKEKNARERLSMWIIL